MAAGNSHCHVTDKLVDSC